MAQQRIKNADHEYGNFIFTIIVTVNLVAGAGLWLYYPAWPPGAFCYAACVLVAAALNLVVLATKSNRDLHPWQTAVWILTVVWCLVGAFHFTSIP